MKRCKKTVVVFGCTGTVGKYVLEGVLSKGLRGRGVLRDPSRAFPLATEGRPSLSYVAANLSNADELTSACAHADALFLLTATDPRQIENERNVIRAAKQNEIKRIVKLSAPDVPDMVEVAKWHGAIERLLDESGMEYCAIRPYAFMQNWERNVFTIRRFGKIYGALQQAPRNYVDARDVAEVAVNLLCQDESLQEKFISITGPEAITNYEMADRLSYVTGRKINYVDMAAKDLMKMLIHKAKIPNWLAKHIVELDTLALRVPEPKSSNIEPYLLKKPRIMSEYLLEKKACFRKAYF